MERRSVSITLLVIGLVAFVYYKIRLVELEMGKTQHLVYDRLRDLKAGIIAANRQLEKRVLRKSKKMHTERLDYMENQFTQQVATLVEGRVMSRVKDQLTYPVVSRRSTRARVAQNLELLAMMKEYSLNYQSSSISKDVRRWFTYVMKNVNFVNRLKQNDQLLIYFIMIHLLIPPAPMQFPYNLQRPNKDQSMGMHDTIWRIFNKKTNGTFVECRALDGEISSGTLTLEKDFGWTGALIEGNPQNVHQMLTKNRKSWIVPACVSIYSKPLLEEYTSPNFHYVREAEEEKARDSNLQIHCFPLTSILFALKMTNFDFLKLNNNGRELEILRTIDFKHIKIKVILVHFERKHIGEKIKSLLRQNDYRVHESGNGANYGIFMKQE